MSHTAHATLPEQSTVHVNGNGEIEFMTPDGQRGEITEHGAALFDGNLPLVELTFEELSVDDTDETGFARTGYDSARRESSLFSYTAPRESSYSSDRLRGKAQVPKTKK